MHDALGRLRDALNGRYTVERELGRGGMAVVYLAEDLRHGRRVALKVLQPEGAGPGTVQRFLKEIRTAAQLHHPHILSLFDSGSVDELLYYVMPFVDGETLRDRLEREGALQVTDAVRITREVADAIDYANGHGVVHRDIKPENIFLVAGHALVGDFGIARAADVARLKGVTESTLTEAGVAVGTAAYMSPEQAMAEPKVDGRSDQYSLGCVLYEMLAGQPPFTGPTSQVIMARHTSDHVPPLATVRAVPADLERAVVRALAKIPADRWPTATAFAEALGSAVTAHVSARTQMPAGQQRVIRSAIGSAAVIVTALAGWLTWPSRTADATDVIDSIAVLPFIDLSKDTTRSAIVDALHVQLIGALGSEGAFRTISPQSVLQYRYTVKTLADIARELGVDAVLSGNVLSIGDSLMIQLTLSRSMPDERTVWNSEYSANLADVFSLQSTAARDVANFIDASGATRRGTRPASERAIDPVAYEAYAKGIAAWNTFTAPGLRDAEKYLQEAIRIAPDFAQAYAGLAHVSTSLSYYVAAPPREAFLRARRFANTALQLDSATAEAWSVLGWVASVVDHDWGTAEAHFRRAVQLNPSYAVGHMWLAWYLAWVGHFDEAIQMDLKARSLDPLSPRVMAHLGLMYHAARQNERSIQLYQETIRQFPRFYRAHWDLGYMYSRVGDFENAIRVLEQVAKDDSGAGGTATNIGVLAEAYALAGRRNDALRILKDLEAQRRRGYVPAKAIAHIYIALGDFDTAMNWLEAAMTDTDGDMVLLNVWPIYDPIRNHPRFQALLRRMNFPKPGVSAPNAR